VNPKKIGLLVWTWMGSQKPKIIYEFPKNPNPNPKPKSDLLDF
jgi:hypothetical protein